MRNFIQNPKMVLFAVFSLSFCLFLFFVFNLNSLEIKEERTRVLNVATSYSYSLKSTINRALSSANTIAALLNQGDGVVRNFELVAENMLPLYPGVIEIALAPRGIVSQVAPLKGNEKALGLNLFENKSQNKESFLARDTGKHTLAGPLTLVQGGEGLVGRLPIFLNENDKTTFWGFVMTVIKIADIGEAIKREYAGEEQFAYEVWKIHPDTQQKQIIFKSSQKTLKNPINYTFNVPNNEWTISIEPLAGWANSYTFLLRVLLVFFFSVLLAYLAKSLVELKMSKCSLENEVIQTIDEKIMLQKKLRILLDSIPDLIWLKDTNGIFMFCNHAFEKLYGTEEKDIIGKSDYDFVGEKEADFFRANDMFAMNAQASVVNEEELTFKENGYKGLFETIKTPFYNNNQETIGILGIARDISKRKESEEKIKQLEYFDTLTTLPNKTLLGIRLMHDISIAHRRKEQLAVLFIDFDHFKNINDTLGHNIGDELLREVARRLKMLIREVDTISRQGGDEFFVVLPNIKADSAALMAKKILQAIEQPISIGENELVVTASIGIALYPQDGEDKETLFRCADVAMYQAKQNGRNNYRFFTAEIQQLSSRFLVLGNALRYAHSRGEFSLHYQPQIDLMSGKLIGFEALLRWTHPELGMISPVEFIPVAEESGQILFIGEWVLRTAALRMKQWIDMGFPLMRVAVNLSAVQFHHEHLSRLVTIILDEVKLPPEYLELELTEGVAAQDPLRAIEIMNTLYQKGIMLSIDDFGTGYSSLSYLKKFKVYKLKIDRSFIADISNDPDDRAIVKTIIALGKSLGLKTIAEGVETKEQLDFLRENGCDEIQGYYFSKPLNSEDCEVFIRNYLIKEQQ